ncbi:hypothetical protein N7451_012301 [Penicillium sp. IBT 35674x]|nr:hypothetical protein N7451_012301 [Penicillium sp. IBT 35674x]
MIRLWVGYHSRKPRTSIRPVNKALNPMQEAASIRYIKQLDELWAPSRSEQPPIRKVSKMWASRFVRRLPEGFFWIKQKPMDKKRIESEDIAYITTWSEHVAGWIEGISPKNIYNFDETGFIRSKKHAAKDRGQIVTSVECIAADGWSMVPYLIFKGQTRPLQIPWEFHRETRPTGLMGAHWD